MGEDHPLERLELLGRLQPELFCESQPRLLEHLERIHLATAAVEGQHLQVAEPLARGVRRRERLDLAHHLGVATELEQDVDPPLHRLEPQLVEPLDGRLREIVEHEIRQRRAAPERERLRQQRKALPGRSAPRLVEQALEPPRVDRCVGCVQEITRGPGLDRFGAELAPQAEDRVLE